MPSNKLGNDFELYYIAGTDINSGTNPWIGTGPWTQAVNHGDITFDRAPKSVEIPKRNTNHTKYKQGRFDQRLTVSVNYDPDDAFFQKIETAVANQTHLHLRLAEAAHTGGSIGWEADYCVVGDPLSAAIDDRGMVDVEFAVWADSVNEPATIAYV
jgi:hypothetical protein